MSVAIALVAAVVGRRRARARDARHRRPQLVAVAVGFVGHWRMHHGNPIHRTGPSLGSLRAVLVRRPGGGDAVLAELAAELVAAPLDLDVLTVAVPASLARRGGGAGRRSRSWRAHWSAAECSETQRNRCRP